MRKTVVNEYGVNVDYDLAVSFMDDDLREEIHGELAQISNIKFSMLLFFPHIVQNFGDCLP